MKREDKLGINDDWDVRKRPVNRTTKLNGGCTKHCCCGIRQPTSCPQALCLTLLVCPLTETAKTTETMSVCLQLIMAQMLKAEQGQWGREKFV
jgi:hypothetical protein